MSLRRKPIIKKCINRHALRVTLSCMVLLHLAIQILHSIPYPNSSKGWKYIYWYFFPVSQAVKNVWYTQYTDKKHIIENDAVQLGLNIAIFIPIPAINMHTTAWREWICHHSLFTYKQNHQFHADWIWWSDYCLPTVKVPILTSSTQNFAHLAIVIKSIVRFHLYESFKMINDYDVS